MNSMNDVVRKRIFGRGYGVSLLPALTMVMLAGTICLTIPTPTLKAADAATIVDEWGTIKAPPAPELKPIKIDVKTTALLVLDIVTQGCNNERRPRCVTSIPKIQSLLNTARGKGMLVVHSITGTTSVSDIIKDVAPRAGEPVVKSSVDKFYGTDLEKILSEKGIKNVIIAGTASNGAVLYTATGAVLRGLKVIVPVETMSAEDAYAEQYTAWHLLNAPGNRGQVALTRADLLQF